MSTTINPADLGTVDFSKMSQAEILDFMQNMQSTVKAAAEQETARLREEYRTALQGVAEHVVANGEVTETALWAGIKVRGEVLNVFGEAYNVNVTLTHVTRKAALVAKKATGETPALEVVADETPDADDAA